MKTQGTERLRCAIHINDYILHYQTDYSSQQLQVEDDVIQLIQNMCQFRGGPDEDPNEYIKNFLKICDTQKHNEVSSNAIRLMLFSFSIKEKTKIWFYFLPKETIVT